MKKNIFFAAALVFGMISFASCSSSEGENAANDESVAGATDGVEVVDESATVVEGCGACADSTQCASCAEGVCPEVTECAACPESDGKTIVEKGKEVVEKGKDVVKEGVEKGKEAIEKGKEAVEKGKEALNNLKK